MKPKMQSKNVSGYEDTGLGGGSNKLMKVRQVLYRAAAAIQAGAGLAMSATGVAMGSDQLAAAGMGMVASVIVPLMANESVSEKLRTAMKARASLAME